MSESSQKPESPSLDKWRMAQFAAELGFIIALPLLALGFLGKFLDNKWGTEPYLALAGILLAIISTTVWLTRRIKELINSTKK